MTRMKFNSLILFALIAINGSILAPPAFAQNGSKPVRTDNKITYHNGPVMAYNPNVYLIWYGCWNCGLPGSNPETAAILTDLVSYLGWSPYFLINTGYPDARGLSPLGGLIYAGAVNDASYSHGPTLTVSDIEEIVAGHLDAGNLPLDPIGIYIVITSSDVTEIRPDGSTFCARLHSPPLHGYAEFMGTAIKYAFIGNAARCPTSAAPQFIAPDGSTLPSPNGQMAADAMASSLAHALDAIVTNPIFTGWYDRYGLENAGKCLGAFGETYTTANGARANMRLGQRDFLIQQNWVNGRRGYCGLSLP